MNDLTPIVTDATVIHMNPTPTFTATVSASSASEALRKVDARLPKGFALTGRSDWRSERHLLMNVEVQNCGGDVNDCWVILTSYGISPSAELGSSWADAEQTWIEASA